MIILVATEEEYLLARERYRNDKIIKTGIGALNVMRTLCKAICSDEICLNSSIINFGYVGSNKLPIGTEVEIKQCKLYHPNVEYEEKEYILQQDGYVCYTSNDFVLETNIEEPVVFDMELAYILAIGFTNVKSIKIVSDNLSLKEYENNIK